MGTCPTAQRTPSPSSPARGRRSPYPRAVVLLDGLYDDRYPEFYAESCARDDPFVVCADGALRSVADLMPDIAPQLVVGDMDSLGDVDRDGWEQRGTRFDDTWDGQTAKDYTDGQLALYAALNEGPQGIDIHGALPRRDAYDHDHFLGNLSLISEARERLGDAPDDAVRIAEPLETIALCRHRLTLRRVGVGLNRVSLVACGGSSRVARSEGLRWDLAGLEVCAAPANALRNEFTVDATTVTIEMARGSAPVYVFHNRYDQDAHA